MKIAPVQLGKSPGTELISMLSTPRGKRITGGPKFSMTEVSEKGSTQQGSCDSREKSKDEEISLSPIDSACPLGSVESRIEIDLRRPNKARGSCRPHGETMLIKQSDQILDEISCPSGVSKGRSWKLFPQLVNSKGTVNGRKVMDMSLNQLTALGKEKNLDISPECSIRDRQQQSILRLEWLGKRSILKAPITSAWAPPVAKADRENPGLILSVNSTVNIIPEVGLPHSVSDPSIVSELKRQFEVLKTENSRLLDSLKESESLRQELEKRFDVNHNGRDVNTVLEIMRSLKWTRDMAIQEDTQAGLLFDLEKKITVLRELDENMAKINHASRDGKEWPVAIVSENELETVSYPINNNVRRHLGVIDNLMKENINMAGHMVIPSKFVDVTAGFAGAKGNLIWINTGNSTLLLKVVTDGESSSMLLKPGFGFCLGRRKNWAHVYLSSPERADVLFNESGPAPSTRPHVMFFGSDRGTKEVGAMP